MEAAGLAFGALSVVDIGFKIRHLKDLWSRVCDAPQSVAEHLGRIECLQPVLEVLEEHCRCAAPGAVDPSARAAHASIKAAKEALESFDAQIKELERLIKQSESKGRVKRTAAKVKVVLRNDVVGRLDDRLQRAWEALNSAQMAHIQALGTQSNELMLRLVVAQQTYHQRLHTMHQQSIMMHEYTHEMLEQMSITVQAIQTPSLQPDKDSQVVEKPQIQGNSQRRMLHQKSPSNTRYMPFRPLSFFGSIETQVMEVGGDNEDEETPVAKTRVYRARLQIPSFLSRKVWDFIAERSCEGWGLSSRMRAWCIRPWNSPVFQFASEGDFENVFREILCGRASFYDKDDIGWTLLHFAASKLDLPNMKLLVDRGLDLSETDQYGETPIINLTNGNSWEGMGQQDFASIVSFADSSEDLSTLFLQNATQGVDLLDQDYLQSWNLNFFLSPLWFECSYKDFLLQSYHIRVRDLHPHLLFATLEWRHSNLDPEAVLAVFQGPGGVEWEKLRPHLLSAGDYSQGAASVANLATTYFRYMRLSRHGREAEHTAELWRDLARQTFKGCRLSAREVCGRSTPTPLMNAMEEQSLTPSSGAHVLSNIVLRWLEDLQASGIDLVEYGRAETQLWAENGWIGERRWGHRGYWDPRGYWCNYRNNDTGPILKSYMYGPRPEDWSFTWDLACEEYVGDFWELMDHPPLQIPGAWGEEQEYRY